MRVLTLIQGYVKSGSSLQYSITLYSGSNFHILLSLVHGPVLHSRELTWFKFLKDSILRNFHIFLSLVQYSILDNFHGLLSLVKYSILGNFNSLLSLAQYSILGNFHILLSLAQYPILGNFHIFLSLVAVLHSR